MRGREKEHVPTLRAQSEGVVSLTWAAAPSARCYTDVHKYVRCTPGRPLPNAEGAVVRLYNSTM